MDILTLFGIVAGICVLAAAVQWFWPLEKEVTKLKEASKTILPVAENEKSSSAPISITMDGEEALQLAVKMRIRMLSLMLALAALAVVCGTIVVSVKEGSKALREAQIDGFHKKLEDQADRVIREVEKLRTAVDVEQLRPPSKQEPKGDSVSANPQASPAAP